jgi:hypothetical protein
MTEDDFWTDFTPSIAVIESVPDGEARAYAAVGAVVLTASAIDIALLDIAIALLPVAQTTAALLFSKARHLEFVDTLVNESAKPCQEEWRALKPRIEEAIAGPRHLGAHGHLEVRPTFEFSGVPGPAGTLESTAFTAVGKSAVLLQHPALVLLANKKQKPFTPEELIAHCRKQAQVLADIRAFVAKLERSP